MRKFINSFSDIKNHGLLRCTADCKRSYTYAMDFKSKFYSLKTVQLKSNPQPQLLNIFLLVGLPITIIVWHWGGDFLIRFLVRRRNLCGLKQHRKIELPLLKLLYWHYGVCKEAYSRHGAKHSCRDRSRS